MIPAVHKSDCDAAPALAVFWALRDIKRDVVAEGEGEAGLAPAQTTAIIDCPVKEKPRRRDTGPASDV